MNWTAELKGQVAVFLGDGLSATQIAERFGGGLTRNAVIGVVQRDKALAAIGFSRAPGWQRREKLKKAKAEAPKPIVIKVAPLPPKPEPVLPIKVAHGCGRPIYALGSNQCRFGVNDVPRGGVFLFCGEPADGNWCQAHRRIVYREEPAR
jgi:hypothetical protein